MRSRLKSVGVVLALISSGACCFADTARGGPFTAKVSLPKVYAQTQTASPAKEQRSSIGQLLETAEQHFRRAEFKQAIAAFQQVVNQSGKNAEAKVEALIELGYLYSWMGQASEAETYFQQALKLARDSQYRKGEARALAAMGIIYRNRQKYDKALKSVNTALTTQQQMRDLKGEALSHLTLGIVRHAQAQYPEALKAFQQALDVAEADNNQDELSSIYNWMAIAYRELKDLKQADQWIQKQQAQAQAIGHRLEEYSGLWTVASLQQKQPEQVLQTYQKALAIAQAADNVWFQRSTLLEIGGLYVNQKQPPKALETYQKALALARTIDVSAVADVQSRIGVAYYQAKQYPQALAAYQQALATYATTQNNEAEIAQVWVNIGDVEWALKNYPKFITAYEKAASIYQKLKNENKLGNIYYWIGSGYYHLEKYTQALDAYQQALKRYQAANRLKEQSQTWKDIGYAYNYQEQYSQALAAHQKSLEIARKIPDKALELNALMGKGFVHTGQGQSLRRAASYKEAISEFENAILLWQQVQVFAKELKNVQSEQTAIEQISLSYYEIGSAFQSQQQYVESIAAIQKGLTFWRQHQDRLPTDKFLAQERSILQQLGSAYFNSGLNYAKAVISYQEALKRAEQLNELKEQIYLLGFIATSYSHLGEYAKALKASQQQLNLAQNTLKDRAVEMGALIKVGQTHGNLGQVKAEVEHYQQALIIARSLKKSQTEAILLNNIGSVYSRQGEYLQALELSQQALGIFQAAIRKLQSGDAKIVAQLCDENFASLGKRGQQQCLQIFQYGIASSLNNLAFAYHGLGRYTDAIKAYEQALEMDQLFNNLNKQAALFNNIGSVYRDVGNYGKALEFFQQSLKTAIASETRPDQAVALNSIGLVYAYQGNSSKALDYYQRSLDLAQAIQSPRFEATALNNMGAVYQAQGNYTQALEFYQKALIINRNHRFSITTGLNNIANIYLNQGQYFLALEQLQQALEISRKTGDRPQEVILLRNIGETHQSQSNYAKALESYQQAQSLSQVMGSRSSELLDLLTQGKVYRDLGQYPKALKLFQQALTWSRELGEKKNEAVASATIGDVYYKQGQYPQALQFYQQALNFTRESGDIGGESRVLQKIAQIYREQKNFLQGEALLQQSLTIQRKTGLRPDEARTLNTLGQVYLAQGKVAEAQESFQQAYAIAQSINDRTTQAETLADLGKLFQAQPEVAIAFYKQSVNTYEGIRTGIRSLSKEQQDSYTQTIADTYRQLANLLIAQGRLSEAQQVLEFLKIQEINDYNQGVRSATRLSDVQLNEIEEKILKEHQTLIAFTQKLNECNNCPQKSELRTQLEAILARYHRTVQALQEASRKNRAVDDSFLDPNSEFGAVARNILKQQPGTVILYPLVLENRIWILMASEGGLLTRYEVKVNQQELNETVFELQKLLQSSRSDQAQLKALSQKLYDWLIKPLEPELKTTIQGQRKVNHLIFALDRVTRYIPMSVLFDGKQYLVENYTVGTIVGAGVTDFNTTLQSPSQTSVLGVGLSEAKADFGALPNVPLELDVVVKQSSTDSGIYPGRKFLNQMFTFNALQNDLKNKQILHIATHGKFVPGRANQSYLLLGTGEKLTIPEIGLLQHLGDVHMVVLSACQTALGGNSDGVEISGVSNTFLAAGVKTVLASLWNVNDASTSQLMQQFYKNLASGKMSKAEALRQAQLSLLKGNVAAVKAADRSDVIPKSDSSNAGARSTDSSFAHPYYWAPFILIGNSR